MNQFTNIDERLELAINRLFTAIARQQRARSPLATHQDALHGTARLSAVYIKAVEDTTRQFHAAANPFVGYTVAAVYGSPGKSVDVNEQPLDLREARILARDLASQYSNLSEILCMPFIAVDKRITTALRTDDKRPEVQMLIGTFALTIACDNRTEAQSYKRALERGLKGQVGSLHLQQTGLEKA